MSRYSLLGIGYAVVLIIYYVARFVIPFGTAIWLSFHNWDYIQTPIFVGIRNFSRLLRDSQFWGALKVTATFAISEMVIALSLALVLALALSLLRPRSQHALLAIYNLPVVIPLVVTTLLWSWLYRPHGGAFNTLLAVFGIPPQEFLYSPTQALWSITIMVVWIYVGNSSVVLLAAINEVPMSLLEAATIDGAGIWTTFRHVTLPMIQPAMAYQVVSSIIGTVQMFAPVQILTGPGHSTRTLSLYTYQLGFRMLDLGFGAAVSLAMFVLMLVATVFEMRRRQKAWL
jgi:multiple sugar transport system permease protein